MFNAGLQLNSSQKREQILSTFKLQLCYVAMSINCLKEGIFKDFPPVAKRPKEPLVLRYEFTTKTRVNFASLIKSGLFEILFKIWI